MVEVSAHGRHLATVTGSNLMRSETFGLRQYDTYSDEDVALRKSVQHQCIQDLLIVEWHRETGF